MRISTIIFSVLLAAATTFSSMAAPHQLAPKATGTVGHGISLKALSETAPSKTPEKGKRSVLKPSVSTRAPFAIDLKHSNRPFAPAAKVSTEAGARLPIINGLVSPTYESPIPQKGIYQIPTSADMSFELVADKIAINQGATKTPDFYVGFYLSQLWGMYIADYLAYNLETGQQLCDYYLSDYTEIAIDLTWDATEGTAYGISYNADVTGMVLAKYDFSATTMTRTVVAPLTVIADMIAADKNGQLWLVAQGDLYKVDKTTAALTKIGATGHPSPYLGSLAFDQKTDRLFMTVKNDTESYICEVNTTTGAATPLNVFEYGDQVVGLYVPAPLAEDGAPDAAQNAVADFPDGTMTGTVEFDAPTTLYDGTEATGKVSYIVTANGELVAQGNTMYGTKGISVTYTAETPGMVEFIIYFYNEVGNSPLTKLNAFVGNGTPSPVRGATASYDNATSTMTVSWLPVTTSSNGGYIDPAKVTYTVYDGTAPAGSAPLAENLKATSWTTTFEAPTDYTTYYYRIVANFEGIVSGFTLTNQVALGSMTPPINYSFVNNILGWTVIDANGDDQTWSIDTTGGEGLVMRYNFRQDMDDWLISMPIRLKAGKLYTLSFDLWKDLENCPELVEIKYGKAPTVEGMTETLRPAADVPVKENHKPTTVDLVCEEDGIYYVGVHGMSTKNQFYIYLGSFSVSEGISSAVPAAVDNFDVTAHGNGVKKADITFDAPALTAAGKPLSAITKIEVSRDGQLVKTFDTPAPGAALSYTDEVATHGIYNYSVVAYNAEGEGLKVEKEVYLGFALPAAPSFATLVEGETAGNATLAWAPVTEDVNGTPLTTSDVSYTVVFNNNGTPEIIATNLVLPAYSYQAVPEGEQAFLQYAVYAVTEAGLSEPAITEFKAMGTPYKDFDETFANGQLHYIWGVEGTDYQFGIGDDNTFSNLASANLDGGFFLGQTQYGGAAASVFTGMISLEGVNNPALSFYTNNFEGTDADQFKVEICERNAEWVTILDSTIDQIVEVAGWGNVICDLSAFAGKTIQVRFSIVSVDTGLLTLDDVKIVSLLDNDLAVVAITAPATVDTNTEYPVEVVIENAGAKEAKGYKVELSADGEVVKTFEGAALAQGEKATFSYTASFAAIATEPVTYSAKIVYAEDMNVDNNQTEEVVVMPKASKLPVVTDLQTDGIKLFWTAPDLTAEAGKPVTVDFEDGESFAHEYEGFTFVDGDASAIGGFSNVTIPGVTPGSTLASFFVFDSAYQSYAGNPTFAGHSGDKYLVSMFRSDKGTSDDWMISPELKLGGQTVSFYAKSYSADDPEKMKLCYSKTGTDVASFEVLETVEAVPGDWTLYTVELPADARYFAINSCATYAFMLMVDDFTYVPAHTFAESLTIVGYNVWRDGVKITETPVTECEFSDPDAPEGQSTYVVTVVYDLGESGASNEVAIGVSGLDEIGASLEITTIPGAVVVKGAGEAAVTVFSIDGKTVYAGKGDAVIPAPAGIYVVKAADKVAKVLVK